MSDHERIWLQHPDDAEGQEYGRMWAENKVWPNHPEDHEPTEYVRADLYDFWKARAEKAEVALTHIEAGVYPIIKDGIVIGAHVVGGGGGGGIDTIKQWKARTEKLEAVLLKVRKTIDRYSAGSALELQWIDAALKEQDQ